jgi:hypothetical protein
MAIVLHIGRSVNEYNSCRDEEVKRQIELGNIRCELCTQPMKRHSSYTRKIKETGERIRIVMVWCRQCKIWHALLPDFLLPCKHYSGNEIESVIIDSATVDVKLIDTAACGATVCRWIHQIGERIVRAVGALKYQFGRAGQAVCEAAMDAGTGYSELEQVLDMAPLAVRYSGNKLGLANLWLGKISRHAYI